jgi:HEAT repeat protein/beta-lactamase regulating signal transducer with metallopeptidase domain
MSPVLVVFGWLVTYAAHSTLLLGAAWMVNRRRGLHPAARDVIWKAALVGGLVTASVPALGGIPVVGPRWMVARQAPAAMPAERSPSAPAVRSVVRSPDPSAPPARPLALDPVEPSRAVPVSAEPAVRWPAGLVIVWGLFAGSLLLVHGRRWWQLRNRLAGRVPLEQGPLTDLLAELARSAGVRRRIRITVTDRLASPVALGAAEICVPAVALADLTPPQQRSMLAHELGHLVRLDAWWLALGGLLERIFFFQPLNRVARVAIQQSAELLCDAWAAERTGSPLTMAHCLVKVAEWIDASPALVPVAGMAEERSQLVDRVRRLVEEQPMVKHPNRRWLMALAVVVLGGVALVAPRVSLVGQDPVKPRVDRARIDPVVAAAPEAGRSIVTPSERAALAGAASLVGPSARAMLHGAVPGGAGVDRPEHRQSADSNGAVVLALVAALKDSHPDVRRAAAQSLGSRGDRRAVTGLVEALKDTDAKVRVAAAEALGSLNAPAAIGSLTAATKDPSADVRRAAFEALLHFDAEEVSADAFLPGLRDATPEIRAGAARALGERKEKRAVPELITMLKDGNAELRQVAIQALANLGDRSALEPIAAAIKDPSADVRQSALEALGELQLKTLPPAALDALNDDHEDVREAAVHLAAQAGDRRAVPALRQLLSDERSGIRSAAVEALSEIRDAAAIDGLVAALKSSDPVVRRAAAEALGQRER